jgi:hypothetical protein
LAATTPEGDSTNGIDRVHYPETNDFSTSMDSAMKSSTIWDPERYLNIWVMGSIYSSQNTGNQQVTGYSYYPAGSAGTYRDGIVVRYDFFGREGSLADDDRVQGRTVTHEVGHYLNLLHPWGGEEGNCSDDDHVDDTPTCRDPFFSSYSDDCPAPVQCGQTRMIENYMDYSDDRCMNVFTRGQSQRMRASIMYFRPQLVTIDNRQRVGCSYEDTVKPVTSDNRLDIYPNPAQDHVMVFPDKETIEHLTIKVYNQKGQQVRDIEQQQAPGGGYLLDFSKQPAGVYVVKVKADDLRATRTVVIYQ